MVKNFLIVLKNLQRMQQKLLQKTAEATGDLIGNKIVDKITSVSTELHSKRSSNKITKWRWNRNTKERKKRQQVIDELKLVQQYNGISKNKFFRQCTKSTIQI